MRSSEASGSPVAVFQRKPWLHWLVVIAIPMAFFFIYKLASLSTILNVLAPRDEDRTAANQATGVLLGMLEDFIVTVLLVTSLVIVDLAALLCARGMIWAGTDEHFHTAMILRGAGRMARFVAVFTLVTLTLAPFSLDMSLLRSQKTRFASDQASSVRPLRDGFHSQGSSHTGSDFDAMLGVVLVAFTFAFLFVWLIDLVHWLPTHEEEEEQQSHPVSQLSFSTPTYMDIRFEPYKVLQMDMEAGKDKSARDDDLNLSSRQTTIVSAPSELYGDDDVMRPSHAQPHATLCRATLLDPWLRIVLVLCAGLSVFLLFVDVTRAASQLASPLVAGIALNASLNELVHNLFQVQFLPPTV